MQLSKSTQTGSSARRAVAPGNSPGPGRRARRSSPARSAPTASGPPGDGYSEVLGVAYEAEARASDLGRAVVARSEAVGDGLMGWGVEVGDAHAVAERLGVSHSTISREGLSAGLAGLAESMREP